MRPDDKALSQAVHRFPPDTAGYRAVMERHRALRGAGPAAAVALLLGLTGCGDGTSPPAAGQDAIAANAAAQPSAGTGQTASGVTVLGEGRMTATPDTARVVVGVEVSSTDVGNAFTEASVAAGDVLDALRAAGVDDADIRTQDISVREQRERPPDPSQVEGPPEVIGYTVTNLVEVTVRDVDRAGEVIATAVEAGGDAARVQQFRLTVDQDDVQLDEARRAAFADARHRAEQYADTAGRSLGDLASMTEVHGPVPVSGGVPEGAGDVAVRPPVEPGQEQLTVRIQATWHLE